MKNKINLSLATLMIIGLFVITAEKIICAQLVVQKADMPTARWDHASCVVNGIIYVFGGGPGIYSSVEAYDPGTDTWAKKANMPTARMGPSACVVNGIIYVIGGWGGSNVLSTVEAYDPSTNTWTKKADMPSARYFLTTNAVNGAIHAIGGWPLLGAVEAYDPSTDTWTKKASILTGRFGQSSCVVNGSIYAIGGQVDANGSQAKTVEVYDPLADRWTEKSSIAFANAWFATCAFGNMIYSIDGMGTPSSIMVYDPVIDIWKPVTNKYSTRTDHTANIVNGKIYVIGGSFVSNLSQATNSVSEYDPLRAPKRPQMEDTKDKLATLWSGIKVKD